MKILITNANSRMTLCLARALSKIGYDIIVADYIPNAMTFFSKRIIEHFLYPSPYSLPDKFINTLIKKIKEYNIAAVIPVHEEGFLISKQIKEVAQSTCLAVPDYQALLNVHNKDTLTFLLNTLNILTPKTLPLIRLENETQIRKNFSGPILIKPRQGGGNWGIQLLNPKYDLNSQINNYLETNHIDIKRLLLQEFIPVSHKFSHVVIYQKGKLVQDFADEHLRDFPLSGGAGCLRKSFDSGPMTNISQKLFDNLNWHGIAEVEYITHAETGKHYFIEVNPRIWGGVNSAIASGINIGEILIQIALGKTITPLSYETGIKTRWFWGDMRVLPQYLSKSKNKLSVISEYLRLFLDKTKSDEFQWKDPLPFFIWPLHALFKLLRYRSLHPVTYDSLNGEWE